MFDLWFFVRRCDLIGVYGLVYPFVVWLERNKERLHHTMLSARAEHRRQGALKILARADPERAVQENSCMGAGEASVPFVILWMVAKSISHCSETLVLIRAPNVQSKRYLRFHSHGFISWCDFWNSQQSTVSGSYRETLCCVQVLNDLAAKTDVAT